MDPRPRTRRRVATALAVLACAAVLAAAAAPLLTQPDKERYDPGTMRIGDRLQVAHTSHRDFTSEALWAERDEWTVLAPETVHLTDGRVATLDVIQQVHADLDIPAFATDDGSSGKTYFPPWSHLYRIPGTTETVAREMGFASLSWDTYSDHGLLGTGVGAEEEEVSTGREHILRMEGPGRLPCMLHNPLPAGTVGAGTTASFGPCTLPGGADGHRPWSGRLQVASRATSSHGPGWLLSGTVEAPGSGTATQMTWVVAEGIPYPLRIELREDGALRERYEVSHLERGGTPLAEIAREERVEPLPALVFGERKPWLFPDEGVDHPYPLSRAWQETTSQPQGNPFQEYVADHPDAYAAVGSFQRIEDGPLEQHEWFVNLVDEDSSMRFRLVRTVAADAPDLSLSIWVEPLGAGSVQTLLPPSRLPDEVPTLVSLLAQAEARGQAVDEGLQWSLADNCMLTCPTQPCEDPFRCKEAFQESPGFGELQLQTTVGLPAGEQGGEAELEYNTFWSRDLLPTASSRSTTVDDPSTQWQPGSADIAVHRGSPTITLLALGSAGLLATLSATLLLKPALVSLFSRIRPDEMERHPQRHRIMETVRSEPGIHYRALLRRTGIPNGSLDHHVHQLASAGRLTVQRGAGRTRYFPAGAKRDVPAVAQNPGAQALLHAVAEVPGASAADLARRLALSRATITYHTSRLADAGLLRDGRDGRATAWHLSAAGEDALAAGAS